MKNIINCVCADKWGEYAPLVLRVVLGLIFAMHGWQKLTEFHVEGVTGMLTSMGFPIPMVFAVLLIAAELGGGIALILGLYTHWAAKILAFVALVAFFTAHASHGFFLGKEPGFEYILLIFAASVSVMITGAGKYSLDASLGKKG